MAFPTAEPMNRLTLLLLMLAALPAAICQVTFGPAQVIHTSHNDQKELACGDIDGDGDADVLISYSSAGEVYWHANLGQGIFGERIAVATNLPNAQSPRLTDLDGDGDPDVVVVSPSTNVVRWFANDGNGNYAAGPPLPFNGASNDVVASDLDGDGDQDLVVTAPGSGAVLCSLNDGFGTFETVQAVTNFLPGAWRAACTDIDLDLDQDVVVVSSVDGSIHWYPNLGNASFASGQEVSSAMVFPFIFDLFDLDGDDDPDILAPGGGTTWFENDGDGLFSPRSSAGLEVTAGAVAAGDQDGDGLAEIYAEVVEPDFGERHLVKAELDSNGNNEAWSLVELGYVDGTTALEIVAIDGAGQADVVVALENAGKVQWFEMVNGGPASGQNIITANALLLSSNLDVIDMDADGDPDIVTAPPFERTTWFENNGSASFLLRSTPILSDASVTPGTFFVADLDGNGAGDLISQHYDSYPYPRFRAHLNDGSGFGFSPSDVVPTSEPKPHYGALADMDGDGDKDILYAPAWNVQDQVIRWRENDGTGQGWADHVIVSSSYDQTYDFRCLATGDLNGDGLLDIIAGNANLGHIAALWRTTNEAWGPEPAILYEPEYPALMAQPFDLEQDGDLDLLTLVGPWNADTHELHVLRNDGVGVFSLHQALSVFGYNDGNRAALKDLDLDGYLDIVYASAEGGRISFFLNNGAGLFGAEQVLSDQEFSSPFKVVAEDMDGDGDRDVLAIIRSYQSSVVMFENLGAPTGMEAPVLELGVYPNPISDRAFLTSSSPLGPDHLVELIALDGKVIRSFAGQGQRRIMIERGGAEAGMYMVRVTHRGSYAAFARLILL